MNSILWNTPFHYKRAEHKNHVMVIASLTFLPNIQRSECSFKIRMSFISSFVFWCVRHKCGLKLFFKFLDGLWSLLFYVSLYLCQENKTSKAWIKMGVGLKIHMYCLLGPRGYSMQAFWIKFCPGYISHLICPWPGVLHSATHRIQTESPFW